MDTHEKRLARARLSLEGLSMADALGGFFEFSRSGRLSHFVKHRQLPDVVWHWTDDTNMALSIYSILRQYGTIDQDQLAENFAAHFVPQRGYGRGARHILSQIRLGRNWREVATKVFEGGSFGNGGAMRVTPLGAYFADDLDAAIENARLSSEITHSHPEGIAGTIAIAVGAAMAWRFRNSEKPSRQEFIAALLSHIPASFVRDACEKARDLPTGTSVEEAVEALGNGSAVAAQDTVPFVLWCAGENLDDYEAAFWQTASGGGDVDTTCAMVGGIVVLYVGEDNLPYKWKMRREPLPTWAFEE